MKNALFAFVMVVAACEATGRHFTDADSGSQGGGGGVLATGSASEAGPDGEVPALDDDVTDLDDDVTGLDDDVTGVPSASTTGSTAVPPVAMGGSASIGDSGPAGTRMDGEAGGTAGGVTQPSDGGAAGTGGTGSGGTGSGGKGSSPDDLLVDGTSCADAAECSSGHCVDGVCCETACADACSECGGTGTEGLCTAQLFDPECGELECPADTECRSYEELEDANCADVGECLAEADCSIDDTTVGTACQQGAGTCDGAGECVVPDKSALGESCDDDDECGSGHCAAMANGAQVCCNEVCTGTCQACAADGFCDAAPADDARCSTVTCPADTTCSNYPANLTTNRCIGFGQCASTTSHCQPTYASATTSCGTGRFCDGMGTCENACSNTQLWCASACVNPSTDEQNCGACGEVCPGTSQCVAGDCECQGATELLCGSSCIDVSSNVSNCGSCGNNCPNVSGSTRTCEDGECGSCGAYSEDCCGTSCSSGLACSSGTCQCAAGSHRCTASNTCASNTDTTQCGSSCVDCRQENASAACGATGCANTCNSGIVTLCAAGSDGKPDCGEWNFESDTVESWAFDLSIGDHASTNAPTVADEAPAGGGNHSLAVPFDPEQGNQVWVSVPLCGSVDPVDISSRDFSVQIMMVTAPDSPGQLSESTGSIFPLSYAGWSNPAGSFAVITNVNYMAEGSWTPFTFPVNTLYGSGTTNVTHIGFMIAAGDWKGTVYIDRFRILP